jgi:ATP-dependent exoDNAse (exonuclease V) alpha subunit
MGRRRRPIFAIAGHVGRLVAMALPQEMDDLIAREVSVARVDLLLDRETRIRGVAPDDDLGGIGHDVRILSAVKAGAAGVLAMNAGLHSIVSLGRPVLSGYAVGEPVMFLKKDYRKDLRNGSLGIVVSIEDAVERDFDDCRRRFVGRDLAGCHWPTP